MTKILPSHYIIGIILFTFFIVGGVAVISEMNSVRSFSDNDKLNQFNNTFNKLDDVTEKVGDLEESIKQTEEDSNWGVFGVLNSLIGGAWNTLQLLFESFGFMGSVFEGLNDMFGVPIWVVTIIGLLISVIISFAIYSAIFQKEI